MRVFLISLAVVILLLLPAIAEVLNLALPHALRMLVYIPATGFEYLTVFFHEIGHTLLFWSYGQPAVPAFDWANGGGVAVPFAARSLVLQGAVYLGAAALGWWLFQAACYDSLAALVMLLGIHAAFVTDAHYMLPVNYMGNGGAVLAGCFFIYRAALNRAFSGANAAIERYTSMIFGLFAVGSEGILLSWKLIASDVAREAYNTGKGESHMANDFTVLADRLDTPLQHVAEFHLAFTMVTLIVTGVLICFGLRAEAAASDGRDVPVLRRPPRRKS